MYIFIFIYTYIYSIGICIILYAVQPDEPVQFNDSIQSDVSIQLNSPLACYAGGDAPRRAISLALPI